MKAKDLAAMLLQCDPEAEVYFDVAEGCCGDTDSLGEPDAMFTGDSPHAYSLRDQREGNFSVGLRVSFPSRDGFRSCRQAAATREAHKAYWERHGKKP
jgi:hypothetical protein